MSQPLPRIRNLQALRAYAALPIIFFHTGFLIPGVQRIGIFGVHLFFMLSGYIMALICDTDTRAFLRRRLIRIIPAYWTLTIALYLAAWKFPHLMNATRAIPMELIKSLLFIPFVKASGLYQPILFVGWTVNYEMYFYVMLGIAVLIAGRWAPLLCSGMVLGVMAVCAHFEHASALARFYANPVLLECLFGLLSYQCVRVLATRVGEGSTRYLAVLSAGALLLLPAVEMFNLLPSAPMILRFGPLCFLIICSTCLLALRGHDIKTGLLVLIGDASYVMYLVHPYIEEFLDRVVGRRISWFHINTLAGCIVAMLVVIPSSIWLYLYVEKPLLKRLNKGLRYRHPSLAAAREDSHLSPAPVPLASTGVSL